MNTRADEALIREINALPPERRAQVVDFVKFLATQERRRVAVESIKEHWARLPQEEITPEIEQMIVDTVREVRAEQRAKRESERKTHDADRS